MAFVVVALFASLPSGRYAAGWLVSNSRQVGFRVIGRDPGHDFVEADWRLRRQFDVVNGLRKFRSSFSEMTPPAQELFQAAGLDPEQVVLRWGNFDQTLLLPARVFEPDDSGRSYRMKPNTKSVWIRTLRPIRGLPSFFLIAEDPAVHQRFASAKAQVVERSQQVTNSWGLRGQEFDRSAPIRGIVLGDSFMQGVFLADQETPPEALRVDLERRLKMRVQVLNTGHLGYSPEQCYFTLREYVDRVNPQFVVLSLFANDFGELRKVLGGDGDWDEGRYWIARIRAECLGRGILCLIVPAPFVGQVVGSRQAASYPGQVVNVAGVSGLEYLDPIEAFVDEQVKFRIKVDQEGIEDHSPLFLGRIGDGHFSALGAKIWADCVGRRLNLLLEMKGIVESSKESLTADRTPSK